MAHNLSIQADGTVEAMFAGKPAWHGLGVSVEKDVSPSAALELAHLKWEVETAPICMQRAVVNLDGSAGLAYEPVDDKVAARRKDTGAYLGTVGLSWKPVQNREQAEFIEALCGEGGAVVNTCGAIGGGRRTFWTVNVPGNLKISERDGKVDEITKYLILCNGHDGTLAFSAFWSPVRVVCQNTLNAALKGVKDGVSCNHTQTVTDRIKDARNILKLADVYYVKLAEQFKSLLEVSIDAGTFSAYYDKVFPVDGERTNMSMLQKDIVTTNFNRGPGADMAGSTLWGGYNAVTQYLDHQKVGKTSTKSRADERKFESLLNGPAYKVQQKAFDTALEMASA